MFSYNFAIGVAGTSTYYFTVQNLEEYQMWTKQLKKLLVLLSASHLRNPAAGPVRAAVNKKDKEKDKSRLSENEKRRSMEIEKDTRVHKRSNSFVKKLNAVKLAMEKDKEKDGGEQQEVKGSALVKKNSFKKTNEIEPDRKEGDTVSVKTDKNKKSDAPNTPKVDQNRHKDCSHADVGKIDCNSLSPLQRRTDGICESELSETAMPHPEKNDAVDVLEFLLDNSALSPVSSASSCVCAGSPACTSPLSGSLSPISPLKKDNDSHESFSVTSPKRSTNSTKVDRSVSFDIIPKPVKVEMADNTMEKNGDGRLHDEKDLKTAKRFAKQIDKDKDKNIVMMNVHWDNSCPGSPASLTTCIIPAVSSGGDCLLSTSPSTSPCCRPKRNRPTSTIGTITVNHSTESPDVILDAIKTGDLLAVSSVCELWGPTIHTIHDTNGWTPYDLSSPLPLFSCLPPPLSLVSCHYLHTICT